MRQQKDMQYVRTKLKHASIQFDSYILKSNFLKEELPCLYVTGAFILYFVLTLLPESRIIKQYLQKYIKKGKRILK